MRVNILVVDDHPVTREGVRLAVCARHAPCVVDICDTIAAAREHLRRNNRYDLILLDYQLPDSRGFSGYFLLHAAAGRVPVAILTANGSERMAIVAKAVGAVGLLSKSSALADIADGIDILLANGVVFPEPCPMDREIADLRDRIVSLSQAQLQVLVAVLDGALNKQIGAALNLTEATVKAHMTAIFRKLGVSSRGEVISLVQPILGDIE